MKLGILLDRLSPRRGGAEAHTQQLIQRAQAVGEDVVVATLEGEAPAPATTIRIDAPRRRPARDRVLASRGIQALRGAGVDCVLAFRHAPGCDVYLPHGGLVGDALHAKDASRRRGRLHRFTRLLSGKVRFFLEAEAALLGSESGPTVIAVSHGLAARIRDLYPAATGRVVTLPNGVDTDHFDPGPSRAAGLALRRELGIDPAAYVGLFFARDPLLKGLETARAAQALLDGDATHPPLHLLEAGFGERDPSSPHGMGPVQDPRPLYAAADVLVHPTWYDPCSLACLEALAMEVPVITTPQNGVSELMGQRGGIVIEGPGESAALAVALRVLADEALRAATADDARWIALHNPAHKQLDGILDFCRTARRAGR